jgi:hypothetical protein
MGLSDLEKMAAAYASLRLPRSPRSPESGQLLKLVGSYHQTGKLQASPDYSQGHNLRPMNSRFLKLSHHCEA